VLASCLINVGRNILANATAATKYGKLNARMNGLDDERLELSSSGSPLWQMTRPAATEDEMSAAVATTRNEVREGDVVDGEGGGRCHRLTRNKALGEQVTSTSHSLSDGCRRCRVCRSNSSDGVGLSLWQWSSTDSAVSAHLVDDDTPSWHGEERTASIDANAARRRRRQDAVPGHGSLAPPGGRM